MLDERKAAILRTVVEEHIRTAQPVGSGHVARATGLSVSSATVRNEMGALERDGYLMQPHTSAGRIPTDKGYRFFVDSMSGPGPLQPAQTQLVRDFFAETHGELERMLADTSRLLSGLTDYAAVVVAPAAPDPGRIRSAQIVSLTPRHAVVVVVLGNGMVEKRTLDFGSDISEEVVATASSRLAAHMRDKDLSNLPDMVPSGIAEVDRIVAAGLDSFGMAIAEGREQHVFVGGAARMAAAFDIVDTVRSVLGILEQQYVLVSLLRDLLDRGLSVAIGTEHGVASLADCSIVLAPYDVEGERVGTVGVLGPTRMHYDQALAAVAVVSKRLGRALSEAPRGDSESARRG